VLKPWPKNKVCLELKHAILSKRFERVLRFLTAIYTKKAFNFEIFSSSLNIKQVIFKLNLSI